MPGNLAQSELELGVLERCVVPRLIDGLGDGPVPAVLPQADLLVAYDPLGTVAGAGRGNRVPERCFEGLCERDLRDSGATGSQLLPPTSYYGLYTGLGKPAR